MEQKTLKEVPSDDLSCVTNPAKDKNRRAAANTPNTNCVQKPIFPDHWRIVEARLTLGGSGWEIS